MWTNITFIRECFIVSCMPYAWMPEASMHIFSPQWQCSCEWNSNISASCYRLGWFFFNTNHSRLGMHVYSVSLAVFFGCLFLFHFFFFLYFLFHFFVVSFHWSLSFLLFFDGSKIQTLHAFLLFPVCVSATELWLKIIIFFSFDFSLSLHSFLIAVCSSLKFFFHFCCGKGERVYTCNGTIDTMQFVF